MIAAKTLAEEIEKGLNANTAGITYVIHSDVGEYKKSIATRTETQRISNGILKIISSSTVPVQNLVVVTQSASLEIIVPFPTLDKAAERAQLHRAILDGYFQSATLQMLTDESGKQYSVGSQYSLAMTGGVETANHVGQFLTFTVMINYTFVQNGVNSSEFDVMLDGVSLGYSSLTVSRVSTPDSSVYSNTNGQSQNYNTTTALTFHFELPMTLKDTEASAAIGAFLFENAMSDTHTLTITVAKKSYVYSVCFGDVNVSIEGIKNAGYTVDLVEAAPLIGA